MKDKNEYLTKHIPYSVTIMLTHKKLSAKTYSGDPDILNAAFVGSIVKGRMLLEMLGLVFNPKNNSLKEYAKKNDDVTAEMLGGTMVKLSDLSVAEQNTLTQFLIAVNKYEAHLTAQNVESDLREIKPAYELILSMVDKHLYKGNYQPINPL